MKLSEIIKALNAEMLCGSDTDIEILTACGSDMMSDVLACVNGQDMLITGLMNPQAVRTAEMLDMRCVCFVRGKTPDGGIIALAKEKNITVLTTPYRMFTACGKLYACGITGGND